MLDTAWIIGYNFIFILHMASPVPLLARLPVQRMMNAVPLPQISHTLLHKLAPSTFGEAVSALSPAALCARGSDLASWPCNAMSASVAAAAAAAAAVFCAQPCQGTGHA